VTLTSSYLKRDEGSINLEEAPATSTAADAAHIWMTAALDKPAVLKKSSATLAAAGPRKSRWGDVDNLR
jgi:hypothetical protein